MADGFGFGPHENYALRPMAEAVDMIVSDVRTQKEIERQENIRQQDIERQDLQREEDIQRSREEKRTLAQLGLIEQRLKEAKTPEEKSELFKMQNEIIGGDKALPGGLFEVPESYVPTPVYVREFFGDQLPEEYRQQMPEKNFAKLNEVIEQAGGREKIQAEIAKIKAQEAKETAYASKADKGKTGKERNVGDLINTIKVLQRDIEKEKEEGGGASSQKQQEYNVLVNQLLNEVGINKSKVMEMFPEGDPTGMGLPRYGGEAEDDLENYLEGYNE